MPRDITVTFADGSTHVYRGAPDQVTPDEVAARAQRDFGKRVAALDGGRGSAPPAQQQQQQQQQQPEQPRRDAYGMTPEDYIREGRQRAINIPAGLLRGAGSIGATLLAPIDAAARALGVENDIIGRRDRREAMDAALESLGADPESGGYRLGKMVAEVAGTAGAGTGVANVIGRVAPQVAAAAPNLIQAIRTGGMVAGKATGATNAIVRAAGGAISGGASAGLVDPRDLAGGAAIGAVAPGAIKAAGAVGRRAGAAAKAAVEPFYEKGQQRIIGRTLAEAAGKDAPIVAQRLAQAREIVPGSVPTVGQAAENPGVAALERAATATSPGITNAVTERMAAQNAARVKALEDIAGTGGLRDFTAANRDATADQLYEAARQAGVDPRALTKEAQKNIKQFMKRIPESVISRARELAKIGGEKMDNTTSIKGLHWVKLGIDDLIGQAKKSGNNTMARQLTRLQEDFLTGLDNMSPDYAAARQVYAQMSRPVNQMDVAQKIAERSINPLTGQLQPAAYARALNDRTAVGTLRMPTATLEKTFDPAQLQQLQAIQQDLARAQAAHNVGRGSGSDTVQKLAYANMINRAGIPNVLRGSAGGQIVGNIAGRVADAAYGRANRELTDRLAQAMLDPKAAANLLQLVQAQQQAATNPLIAAILTPQVRQFGYRVAPAAVAAD